MSGSLAIVLLWVARIVVPPQDDAGPERADPGLHAGEVDGRRAVGAGEAEVEVPDDRVPGVVDAEGGAARAATTRLDVAGVDVDGDGLVVVGPLPVVVIVGDAGVVAPVVGGDAGRLEHLVQGLASPIRGLPQRGQGGHVAGVEASRTKPQSWQTRQLLPGRAGLAADVEAGDVVPVAVDVVVVAGRELGQRLLALGGCTRAVRCEYCLLPSGVVLLPGEGGLQGGRESISE